MLPMNVLLVLGVVVALFSGCSGSKDRTSAETSVLEFKTPNILLFTYESPALVPTPNGSTIEVRAQSRPKTTYPDIVIIGVGAVDYGARRIVVQEDSISVDGGTIPSLPKGTRNAVLMKDGTIKLDAFFPFESRTYPSRQP